MVRAKHVLNLRHSISETVQLIRHRCSVFLMIFFEMCSMGASWCHMINSTNRVVALKLMALTEKTHRLSLLLLEACAAHPCLCRRALRAHQPVSELHMCSVSARPQDKCFRKKVRCFHFNVVLLLFQNWKKSELKSYLLSFHPLICTHPAKHVTFKVHKTYMGLFKFLEEKDEVHSPAKLWKCHCAKAGPRTTLGRCCWRGLPTLLSRKTSWPAPLRNQQADGP